MRLQAIHLKQRTTNAAKEQELAIRDVEGRTRQESEPATEQELAIRDVEGRTRQESELGLPRVDSGIVGDTDIVTRATPFVVRFSTGEEPDNTAGSCPAGQQEARRPPSRHSILLLTRCAPTVGFQG